MGREVAEDRVLDLREEGSGLPGPRLLPCFGSQQHPGGPWLRRPGSAPDPTAPVQPFVCPSSQHWVGDRKRPEETRQEERGGGVL